MNGKTSEPSDAQIEAFKVAWREADARGEVGERVRSGLRAALSAEASPPPAGTPLTKEEEIAFRKDWDARVIPSPGSGGERGPGSHESIVGTRRRTS